MSKIMKIYVHVEILTSASIPPERISYLIIYGIFLCCRNGDKEAA